MRAREAPSPRGGKAITYPGPKSPVKEPKLNADALIAGAGPVGLSLAAALTQAGLRVIILEASGELSSEARASTFHPPTLEMFAEWGVADQVIAHGRRIDRLQFWERASRELVADFDYQLIAKDTPTHSVFNARKVSPLASS